MSQVGLNKIPKALVTSDSFFWNFIPISLNTFPSYVLLFLSTSFVIFVKICFFFRYDNTRNTHQISHNDEIIKTLIIRENKSLQKINLLEI